MTQILTRLAAWLGGLFRAHPKTSAATGTAAVLIAAAAFVGPWEGERLEAYLDRIASPPVWTVCYGETKGVKPGDKYTAQQCLDMLGQSLAGYHAQLSRCIPALPQQPQGVQVALTSWTYNVGAGAACGSTLARLWGRSFFCDCQIGHRSSRRQNDTPKSIVMISSTGTIAGQVVAITTAAPVIVPARTAEGPDSGRRCRRAAMAAGR